MFNIEITGYSKSSLFPYQVANTFASKRDFMPRALFSVYDKTGLVEFASALTGLGWDLVASGGTANALEEAGLAVIPVQQLTGVPELLGGRIKTLHPAIHAGILARDTPSDLNDLREHGFAPVNMVVCNLYPFQEAVSDPSIALQDALEQIDIGGVALIRAAAKNFLHVIPVCAYNDYAKITTALRTSGEINLVLRRELAVQAFALTRNYDTSIHAFLSQNTTKEFIPSQLPQQLSLGLQRAVDLRYGENPHQQAAYYGYKATDSGLGGELLGGKTLSYNNLLDADAAWRAVSAFSQPAVVIVKHLNPTGIAVGESISAAYPNAVASDPVSAFGGIIAVNRPVDSTFVEALGSQFIEVIAAPDFAPGTIDLLRKKRANCRLLKIPRPYSAAHLELRSVNEGILVQTTDVGESDDINFKVASDRIPTEVELASLRFAWKTVRHVKSNAIVIAKSNTTIGIGGGLPSRVDAARLAIAKADERAGGAVLASDAFIPFPDVIEIASKAGITAVIQPGGSIRDSEVLDAANQANMAMVFTGMRHFRH